MFLFMPLALAQISSFCAQSGFPSQSGQQSLDKQCSSLEVGLLPDVSKMVSTLITQPTSGQTVQRSTGFDLRYSTRNLNSGFIANLDNQYLMIPQQLGQNGVIKGFTQVAFESLSNNGNTLNLFAVVGTKSRNNNGNTDYLVKVPANVLPLGLTRICTIAASSSGQDVIMPVAQRG